MFPTSFSILFPLETFYTAPCTPPWQSINHPHPTHQPPLLQHHVAFSIKACIKNINQQKFAILHCGIMKTTTVQMFIMILLTQIKKLSLKKSKASRLSKCISLSWKTGKTQNMEFLRRPLENMQEIHLTWSWLILPTVEGFL